MKERIIFAPGLNGNELLKSLALHKVNSIGMRICGAVELARLALMRSGISVKEEFVNFREEAAITARAVEGESYFGNVSFSDFQEIAGCLRKMRCLAAGEEEEQILKERFSKGFFREKNAALLHVLQRYMRILKERNAVDAVCLIRRAAAESCVLDADVIILEEYPLNHLEKALLERVSGGRLMQTRLQDLFGAGDRPVRIRSFKNCYGASNEVEMILTDIYEGKSLDQCTVAVTDADIYGQLFFDCALLYDIPMTFGCGIRIVNANPAKLLSLYDRWITGGFFGAAAIREMLSSSAFDKSRLLEQLPERGDGFHWRTFCTLLENLRLTNDRAVNEKRISDLKKAVGEEAAQADREDSGFRTAVQRKLLAIPCLEAVGRELALPAEEFISRYACIRKENGTYAGHLLRMLDTAASAAINDELKVFRGAGLAQKAEDIIPDILSRTVCVQGSEAGKLHITGVVEAAASVRENLYIAGLSASDYPGSPKENHLLLDADLQLSGPEAGAFTADGRILRKREQLLSLVRLASAMGSEIQVSYAGMNVSELKKENASSLLFELYREEHGASAAFEDFEKHVTGIHYFEPAVSVSRLAGRAYIKGQRILPAERETVSLSVPGDLTAAWSPTALDCFFNCHRRFMLRYLVGIPEPEENDPFEILSAAETGTLAHSLLEELGKSDLTEDAFLALSGSRFDWFLSENPPLIAENVSYVKGQFLDMMETAYRMEPGREAVLEEEDICCTHECGVRLHGFPDRVEKLADGSCLIVDFKSGRRIIHKQDDIDTCLQILVYAYLMEQRGFQVSGAEYRYIRLGKTIACRYDEDMKRQLSGRLQEFKECMQKGCFPPAEAGGEGKDPCRFCGYQDCCGKGGDPE